MVPKWQLPLRLKFTTKIGHVGKNQAMVAIASLFGAHNIHDRLARTVPRQTI
jgi:hypothetical protein